MTQVNIELSSALQTTLGQQGVYAYAVYFEDGDTTPGQTTTTSHWTVLVDGTHPNPTVPTSATIDLPSPYVGGKIYIIIQSQDPSMAAANLWVPATPSSSLITQESDINWTSAQANNYRYDSFELTLTPSANDEGNLTSVNGWGIPMQVDVEYSDGSHGYRGYNQTGDWIWGTGTSPTTGLAAIDPALVYNYAPGTALSGPRMGASPTEAVGNSLPGFAASDWTNYVNSLHSADVTIAGYFNGAPDANHIWHNAGFYSYNLAWDGTDYWLNPTSNSQIKGSIQISPEDLENSIYSTLGNAAIYTKQGGEVIDGYASMNTGANNQWGAVLAQFLTGFTAGYYGGTGEPINDDVSVTVDLNKSWNWDPTYAFGNNHASTSANVFYDEYAKLFFNQTNSYGSGYSDNLMKAYTQGGPLIPVGNTDGSDVSTITLTLFDDSDTPTGYQTPEIANYIAADQFITGGAYVARNADVNTSLNITLNFNAGQMALADGTPLTLGFYTGTTSGVAHFNQVAFPTDQGSLFQNWNLIYDAGTDTYSLVPYSPPVWQPPGSLLVNQWPVSPALDSATGTAIAGGVNWSQITVGSGATAKTFNMYLTADATGQVNNPGVSGSDAALAIDGLAVIVPPPGSGATLPTFPVNFFDGGAITIDSTLLTQVNGTAPGNPTVNTESYIDQTPNAAPWPVPDAPVIGTLDGPGHSFEQLAAPGDPVPTVTGKVAFGWTGADAAWVDAQNAALNYVVQDYTNKVGALNTVKIVIKTSDGKLVTPPHPVAAGYDGTWITGLIALANNSGTETYSATMVEYAKDAHGHLEVVNKTSAPLEFSIHLEKLQLVGSDGGAGPDFLSLDQGASTTEGNWIKLDTTGSSLPNGTLLAYATDAMGNLVGRDGETGPGVTLREATLGHVGSVASDSGSVLFNGSQSVYLGAGLQLHFAVQTGNGDIQQVPGVTITGADTLSVNVSGTFGTLQLLATVNNELSANAQLASASRDYDIAWTYLTEGSTVQVQVAGSAANTNTVHFVLFDVDAATGGWSVGGVAYGNTDAFRAAVQANWDDGFAARAGGGTFSNTTSWTVDGPSGLYVPVLATQGGDIFVVGNANVDGHEHIRMFGENTYGFEDLRANQGSDFDYNDMIVKLTLSA